MYIINYCNNRLFLQLICSFFTSNTLTILRWPKTSAQIFVATKNVDAMRP